MLYINSKLNFNSVPNIIVTQPKLAQVDDIQRPIYLRDFTWQISNTDGQVTAQKILDFVNKRTNRNVFLLDFLKKIRNER